MKQCYYPNLKKITGLIDSSGNIDECLYKLIRGFNDKNYFKYSFFAEDMDYLTSLKKLIAAGANPFLRFDKELGHAFDNACLNNFHLCNIILSSQHITPSFRDFFKKKMNSLISSQTQALFLSPLPRLDFSLTKSNVTEISYCELNVNTLSAQTNRRIIGTKDYKLVPANKYEKEAFQSALMSWEQVANIKFYVALSLDDCRIKFAVFENNLFSSDNDAFAQGIFARDRHEYIVMLRRAPWWEPPINDNLQVLIHELGHVLGLDHAGEYLFMVSKNANSLPFSEATWDKTVMSYFPSLRWFKSLDFSRPKTPMYHDTSAIQYICGANTHFNSENTFYSFDGQEQALRTLWDAGGNDTVSTLLYSSNVIVDLREGGSEPSYIGNTRIWIAKGANIENVITGEGDDLIFGNDLPNYIHSGKGHDVIMTGPGFSYINAEGSALILVHPDATNIVIHECKSTISIDLSFIANDYINYEIEGSLVNNPTKLHIYNNYENQLERMTTIQCNLNRIDMVNIQKSNSFSTTAFYEQFYYYDIPIGIFLGLIDPEINLVIDRILLLANDCKMEDHREKNCRQDHDDIKMIKQILNMIIVSYMTKRMVICRDITRHIIENYNLQRETEKEKGGSIYIQHLKSIGYSLKGILEVGSFYLVTPIITAFCGLVKTFYSSYVESNKENKIQVTNVSWFKRHLSNTFFALDKTLDQTAYYIPGGNIIMDSLNKQEEAIKVHFSSR